MKKLTRSILVLSVVLALVGLSVAGSGHQRNDPANSRRPVGGRCPWAGYRLTNVREGFVTRKVCVPSPSYRSPRKKKDFSSPFSFQPRNQKERNQRRETFSLSFFTQNRPSGSTVRGLSTKIQRQSRIINPGDSSYRQLQRRFNQAGGRSNLSRKERNLTALKGSGFGGNALVSKGALNYSSLRRQVQSKGVSYFGRTGRKRLFLMSNPRALAVLPCGCWACCQPYFVCLPSWMPWPLPPQWIMWVWYYAI